MTNRVLKSLLIFLVAMVVLVFLWPRMKQKAGVTNPESAQVTNFTNNERASESFSSGNISPTNLQSMVQPISFHTTNNIDRELPRETKLQVAVERANIPVKFFGMVIDQNNQPIPEVHIVMNVRHSLYDISEGAASQYPKIDTTTDSDGRFAWLEESGDVLSVETIAKDGYLISPNFSRNFAPQSGSAGNPIVFKMWKTGQKEQLINGDKFWGIIPDGRVYTIDLVQGIKVESATGNGDLRISVNRPVGVSRKDRYDWSFQITAISGGIIETSDEFMYEAPTNGYETQYALQLSASARDWTYRVKKSFYVKSRGSQNYARITLEVFALYQNDGVININYSLNPNGSRNLEPK